MGISSIWILKLDREFICYIGTGKVVYVGQTDKGIANRASDHLVKKFKWDEFSWFTVPKEQLDMVEGMLIEVLQPWENDQRGRGIPEAEIEQP